MRDEIRHRSIMLGAISSSFILGIASHIFYTNHIIASHYIPCWTTLTEVWTESIYQEEVLEDPWNFAEPKYGMSCVTMKLSDDTTVVRRMTKEELVAARLFDANAILLESTGENYRKKEEENATSR